MHVRQPHSYPSRRRLGILLLAGSIGLAGLSAGGQEPFGPPPVASPLERLETPATAATPAAVQAQPAAGPFGEFRISRYPLFGGKKKDSRSNSKFRSPKTVRPSTNVPKPPPLAPLADRRPSTSADKVAETPKSKATVKPKPPQPKVSAIPKKPQRQIFTRPGNPIRSQRPTATPSATVKANRRKTVANDGWVARQAINQDSPLRDPRAKVAKPKSDTRRPARPESKQQPTTPDKKQELAFPDVHTSSSKDKVPSADLTVPTKESAVSAVEADSQKPVLSGPTLNPPKINATPKSKQSSSRQSATPERTLEAAKQPQAAKQPEVAKRREFAKQSQAAQQPQTATKQPQAKIAKALPKQQPSLRQPSLKASTSEDRQRSTAESPYVGSETQYIGTEPRETELDYTGRPAEDLKLSARVLRMKPGIQRVLQYFYDRPEIADQRSNWGMMHSIMVYGVDTRILSGRKSHSAIGWIAGNNICRGKRLLLDDNGIRVDNGVGLQGHQGQFLMVLALADVPADYPLYGGDTKYSVRDLVKTEMAACKSGQELTFTLIGLQHYLDTDASWTTPDGERWDFPRLIREELAQPVVGAACGGTHRLMGFGHALRKRRAEGRAITGQWARAEKFTQDFVKYAYQLQNRDGSMSARWFEGRADDGDTDRKIQTTGHIVEWLLTVTPDAELQNPRLVAGITYLLSAMQRYEGDDKQIGPKGHALRSLAMFYDRVYKSGPAWNKVGIARSGTKLSR